MGSYQCSKQRVHMLIDKLAQFNTPKSLNMYKRSVSTLLKYAPVRQLLKLFYKPLRTKMNAPANHFSNSIISSWIFKETIMRSSTVSLGVAVSLLLQHQSSPDSLGVWRIRFTQLKEPEWLLLGFLCIMDSRVSFCRDYISQTVRLLLCFDILGIVIIWVVSP